VTRVRQLPLWVRYLTAFGVAAIIFVALVIYVQDHGTQAEGLPATPTKSEAQLELRQLLILAKQQQAPRHAKLAPGTRGASAAASAVNAFMVRAVSRTTIAGPFDKKAACSSAGGTAARQAFVCNVYAGAGKNELRYPFDVVVQPSAATVTYCQVITPIDGLKEPAISSACR
jgi:hypothetical protein